GCRYPNSVGPFNSGTPTPLKLHVAPLGDCPITMLAISPKTRWRTLGNVIPQRLQPLPNQRIQLRSLGHLLGQLLCESLHLLRELLIVIFHFFSAHIAAWRKDVVVT